jgi:hypothetical protein
MSPPATAVSRMGGSASPGTNELANAARLILDNCGICFSQNKIVRLVLKFQERAPHGNGHAFFLYLVNAVQLTAEQQRALQQNPEIARVISYADPTGEQAVNRVIRKRGH